MIHKLKKIITIILCLQTIQCKPFQQPNPMLAILLMVKNEAHVIKKTLLPFLQAGIDYYLILDTGSTDDTIEITKKIFSEYHITHGYIIQQPFINFATSRNYAIESAEKFFPQAGFFLMIDAEWYMQETEELIAFCNKNYPTDIDAFGIKIKFNHYEYYVRRLLNASKHIRFVNDLHEYAQISSYQNIPDPVHILWENSLQGYNKSQQRWIRDKELLLQKHQTDPHDLRTVFYLGQTCANLHEYDQAIFWYKQRVEQNGDLEEKLLASYRLAIMYEQLQNWPKAHYYYNLCHQLNPQRAESLIHIAHHYLKNHDYQKSFIFAQKSCDINYPISDQYLVTEPYVYNYSRYVILAISAWYIQEYEIGKNALQKGLHHYPQDPLLLQIKTTYEKTVKN